MVRTQCFHYLGPGFNPLVGELKSHKLRSSVKKSNKPDFDCNQLMQTNKYISSVQSLSHVRHFASPWTPARQASLSITNYWSLLKLMSIKSVMPSNHLILCHPLLLLPSIFPIIRIFSSESVLHIRWPKYWSFSFSISSSNECLELISFRIDWFDILAVPGTLKSLLQHHSSKASILQRSAFFIVQLTSIHDYWKNHTFDCMNLCRQSNASAF